MGRLAALVGKEWLVLRRDAHALALLFVMPAFFILLMSLAMRDLFAPERAKAIAFHLVNADTSAVAAELASALAARPAFREAGTIAADSVESSLRRGGAMFAVVIPAGFGAHVNDPAPRPVTLLAAPVLDGATAQLVAASLREVIGTTLTRAQLVAAMAITTGGASLAAPDSGTAGVARLVAERTLTARGASDRRPTSVQQNVPAWLVFAMFFVALPLSTTWLQERATGTFLRLRSFGVPVRTLLAGKLVPYVAVNLVQVAAMLVVGRWIVPAVGGDALTLGRSPAGLALIAIAVSLAAVSYALLVANVVRTTEQATIVTGVTNLLLGAMGGVMVPRHVMPEALQRLAAFSPMGWGLDGFLDVLLRDGGVREVLPHALALAAFAALALTAAGWRLRRAPVT